MKQVYALMILRGHQRRPRAIWKRRKCDVLEQGNLFTEKFNIQPPVRPPRDVREWWFIKAPSIPHARAVAVEWPLRSEHGTVLAHGRNS